MTKSQGIDQLCSKMLNALLFVWKFSPIVRPTLCCSPALELKQILMKGKEAWDESDFSKMVDNTVDCLQRIIDKSDMVLMGNFLCKEVDWQS